MQKLYATTANLLFAVLVVVLASASAWAQSAQGGLRGTVKDAQGVIPGVTVVLVNEANGTSRETITNDVGEYSFPALEPGAYTVGLTMADGTTLRTPALVVR